VAATARNQQYPFKAFANEGGSLKKAALIFYSNQKGLNKRLKNIW
jgi:hypothetical protein